MEIPRALQARPWGVWYRSRLAIDYLGGKSISRALGLGGHQPLDLELQNALAGHLTGDSIRP